MDLTLGVTLISTLIAALAALYARWVWSEARRTNQLGLHARRIEVLRSLRQLRQSVQVQGLHVTKTDVRIFLDSAYEAKFFFSEPRTVQLLDEYYKICFSLTEQRRMLSRETLTDDKRQALEAEQDRLSCCEEAVYPAAESQVEGEIMQAVPEALNCRLTRRRIPS